MFESALPLFKRISYEEISLYKNAHKKETFNEREMLSIRNYYSAKLGKCNISFDKCCCTIHISYEYLDSNLVIIKYEDSWYSVESRTFFKSFSNPSSDVRRFYLCDEFNGLIQCINSI
jgi:hypothetical protein